MKQRYNKARLKAATDFLAKLDKGELPAYLSKNFIILPRAHAARLMLRDSLLEEVELAYSRAKESRGLI